MKVAVIGGTGPQGLGIAKRFAIEGVEVIVGSRKEEKALQIVEETIEELKDYDLNIVGMANEDAAKAGDILILTVPLAAQKPTLEGIKEFCTDKIVLDATVPLETAIGGKPFRFIDLMADWKAFSASLSLSCVKKTPAKESCASTLEGFNFTQRENVFWAASYSLEEKNFFPSAKHASIFACALAGAATRPTSKQESKLTEKGFNKRMEDLF